MKYMFKVLLRNPFLLINVISSSHSFLMADDKKNVLLRAFLFSVRICCDICEIGTKPNWYRK